MDSDTEAQPLYRSARFEDIEDIAAIEAEAFDEPYRYLMLRQLFDLHSEEWIVAELDGSVVGYALTLTRAGRALLFTFAVTEGRRGRGIGRALLDHALRNDARLGAEIVYLTVRPDNSVARKLFLDIGFELVMHDNHYFGTVEPRDVLEYRLDRLRDPGADRSGRRG